MRAILSVRPKCSHRGVSQKESPSKPVRILKHTTRISSEQTSMRTKWLKHIAIHVQEHLLFEATHTRSSPETSANSLSHKFFGVPFLSLINGCFGFLLPKYNLCRGSSCWGPLWFFMWVFFMYFLQRELNMHRFVTLCPPFPGGGKQRTHTEDPMEIVGLPTGKCLVHDINGRVFMQSWRLDPPKLSRKIPSFSQKDIEKFLSGGMPKPQFWYPPLRFGSPDTQTPIFLGFLGIHSWLWFFCCQTKIFGNFPEVPVTKIRDHQLRI